jgi:phage gpG-like protein
LLSVTVELAGANAALDRIPEQVIEEVAKKVRSLTINLQRHVVADKLQGQVLKHRTGALGRSIQTEILRDGGTTIGRVFSAGDVKYAAIHEFGGRTPPHDIFPSKAQALAFTIGGAQIFAKVVHHPGSNMPERSFLRSSLADMTDQIIAGLREAAIAGAAKAMNQ